MTNNGSIDKYELASCIKFSIKKKGSAKTPNTNCHKQCISNWAHSVLGDSRNYMPPILVPSSAKRIAT